MPVICKAHWKAGSVSKGLSETWGNESHFHCKKNIYGTNSQL